MAQKKISELPDATGNVSTMMLEVETQNGVAGKVYIGDVIPDSSDYVVNGLNDQVSITSNNSILLDTSNDIVFGINPESVSINASNDIGLNVPSGDVAVNANRFTYNGVNVVVKDDLNSYLPLTGGVLQGTLSTRMVRPAPGDIAVNIGQDANRYNIAYINRVDTTNILVENILPKNYGASNQTDIKVITDSELSNEASAFLTPTKFTYNGNEVATVNVLDEYLPLTGGTLTGALTTTTLTPTSSGQALGSTGLRYTGYFASANVAQSLVVSNNITSGTGITVTSGSSDFGGNINFTNEASKLQFINGSGYNIGRDGTSLEINSALNLNLNSLGALNLNGDSLAIRGNTTLIAGYYLNMSSNAIRFYNSASTQIGPNSQVLEIKNGLSGGMNIINNNGSLGISSVIDVNVTTNGKFTYNGNEVATKADIPSSTGGSAQTVSYVDVTGQSTATIPSNAQVVSVNYNRISLFPDDYSVSGTTLSVTNADVIGTLDSTDRLVVTYLI